MTKQFDVSSASSVGMFTLGDCGNLSDLRKKLLNDGYIAGYVCGETRVFICVSLVTGDAMLMHFAIEVRPKFGAEWEHAAALDGIERRLADATDREAQAYKWSEIIDLAPIITEVSLLVAIKWIIASDYEFPAWLIETLHELVSEGGSTSGERLN